MSHTGMQSDNSSKGKMLTFAGEIIESKSHYQHLFALLATSEVRFMSLPSLEEWNSQKISLEEESSQLKLSNYYSSGKGLQIVPIYQDETMKNLFAIVCKPQDSKAVSPQSKRATNVQVVSPENDGKGVKTNDHLPPQWTANETKKAVLRARREMKKTFLDELGSPILKSPLSTASTEISLSSPATAVLDMSGRWVTKTDSFFSPLNGLSFIDDSNSLNRTVTPISSTRSRGKTYMVPKVSSRARPTNSKNCVQLLIVKVEKKNYSDKPIYTNPMLYTLPQQVTSSDSIIIKASAPRQPMSDSFESKLLFSPSPANFSKHFTFETIEEATEDTTRLTLCVNKDSTDKMYIIGLDLTHSGIVEAFHEVYDFSLLLCGKIIKSLDKGRISCFDLKEISPGDGFLRLQALVEIEPPHHLVLEKNFVDTLFDRHSGVDCCTRRAFVSLDLPLKEREKAPPQSPPAPRGVEPIALTLNTILTTMQNFQSSVDQRLERMEKLLLDNSNRITRLESQLLVEGSEEASYRFLGPNRVEV